MTTSDARGGTGDRDDSHVHDVGEPITVRYDLSALRLLESAGEPINPEAWMWYSRAIGGNRCPITDTWWHTATGANANPRTTLVVAEVPKTRSGTSD